MMNSREFLAGLPFEELLIIATYKGVLIPTEVMEREDPNEVIELVLGVA